MSEPESIPPSRSQGSPGREGSSCDLRKNASDWPSETGTHNHAKPLALPVSAPRPTRHTRGCRQAIVRALIRGVQLVEGLNEEGAAAAGGVENPNRGELVLPGFPEGDERGFRGFGELAELVNAGIGQRR